MELKLIKFSAEWCGPCKNQKKEFEDNPIDIEIKEIDVNSGDSEDIALIEKYKVMSIPVMVIVDSEGATKARFVGFTPSNKIKEVINTLNHQ